MVFNPNIPQPNDLLSNSQGQIKDNFTVSDAAFAIDHYTFSSALPNRGFHNRVTTPLIIGGVHPTTTTNPIFYAMQDSAPLGVIQYSRGPSNAVPTPVTSLQSPSSAISGVQPVLNFSGLSRAICLAVGASMTLGRNPSTAIVIWTGSNFIINDLTAGASQISFTVNSTTLQINCGSLTDVYWTVDFLRIN